MNHKNDTLIKRLLDEGKIDCNKWGHIFRIKDGVKYRMGEDDSNNGYKRVWWYENGKRSRLRSHRIVAIKYLGFHPDLEVDHSNSRHGDNRLANISYMTTAANRKIGKKPKMLMGSQVELEALQQRHRDGASINSLAIELNTSWATVKRLIDSDFYRPMSKHRIDGLSLPDYCEAHGLKEYAVRKRLAQGLPLEEAIKPEHQPRSGRARGENSIRQVCFREGVRPATVRHWTDKGYDLQTAIEIVKARQEERQKSAA